MSVHIRARLDRALILAGVPGHNRIGAVVFCIDIPKSGDEGEDIQGLERGKDRQKGAGQKEGMKWVYIFYALEPRAAETSLRSTSSGSLTATPCSFAASATFCPIASTHSL